MLAAGGANQLLEVPIREMRGEQGYSGKVELAVCQADKQRWELACRPRRTPQTTQRRYSLRNRGERNPTIPVTPPSPPANANKTGAGT